MAQLAQEETGTSTGKSGNKPTHFANVSVVTKSGERVRIGAISIFPEPDKAQRTLLQIFDAGGQEALDNLQFAIEIRENVKATDTFDPSEWM